jgi:hypothetical protein
MDMCYRCCRLPSWFPNFGGHVWCSGCVCVYQHHHQIFWTRSETRTHKGLKEFVFACCGHCLLTSHLHFPRHWQTQLSSIHTSAHPRNPIPQHISFVVPSMTGPRKSGRRSSAAASAALAALVQAQSPTSSLSAAPESPSRPLSDN